MPRRCKQPSALVRYWIGYCRKSTDSEDKQVHTLQDQAVMIKAYFDRLSSTERQRYSLKLLQEAQSAYYPGRPVFRTILQRADQGEVQGVIVVHPNRISRNHADSGAFVQRLVEGKIACLATTGGQRYTGDDSNAIFMLTLEGAMSWKDSRDKGDRILQAMHMRAAEGKNMGPVRIGYQSVFRPDGTTVLEVVPTVALLLQRLFALAGSGTYSVQALAAEAERMGLRSRAGKTLSGGAIHNILRDPLYKGYVRFDGIIAKGRHEAIVNEALWNRVQAILTGRNTNTGKPKDLTLRELFVFGNLLKCPRCGRTLSPYRAKGKYVYYECKNPQTDCHVLVPQPVLVEQLPFLLQSIRVEGVDLESLRAKLLRQHEEQSKKEITGRCTLNIAYEQVTKQIGDLFSQRKEAEAMGLLAELDARLADLRRKRDELQGQLNGCHDRGNSWIDKVIRSFELIELLREAIFFGSMRSREMALKSLASNYAVEGKKLVPKLRSPFRQSSQQGGHPEWWTELYDVRTEILETFEHLQAAFWLFRELA